MYYITRFVALVGCGSIQLNPEAFWSPILLEIEKSNRLRNRPAIIIRVFFLCVTSSSGGTHISQVEGDLQVVPEHVSEVGIHVQHFQQVVSQDLVKVAVGQSSDISTGFAWPSIQTDGFTKYVVLS